MNMKVKNKILSNLYSLKSIGYNYISPVDFNEYNNELPNDIDKLKDVVDNCNLCNLSHTSKNKIFLLGDNNAKIVFISTTPMIDKESVKNLFITMIENVLKISKDDICLLSLLKCSSDLELTKISNEIDICKGYMIKQIELINPKLIVTLGDSYNYLLNENKEISSIRGMLFKYNNITLLPMYHPSLLLRNPSLKKDA
ncbi:MAG: uracil-DNA glycosylase, partial [Arcobacteraceae bacterium]|nr:uracil-DNA glycosylase [Arcobacteraceae bacterium]